jgi:hypothetical protein
VDEVFAPPGPKPFVLVKTADQILNPLADLSHESRQDTSLLA